MSETVAPPPTHAPGLTLTVDDGIARLVFDLRGDKVNKLTLQVFDELEDLLSQLGSRSDVQALMITSGKPDQFIAGADIQEILAVTEPDVARRLAARGQAVFQILDDLPFPTAAAVGGPCLGGGLELALACDLRVASDAASVSMGLPEVRLGILPGFGGTQRLPRLVGLRRALDLILAGKLLDGRRALRVGLVDRVVPAAYLEAETAALLCRAVEGGVASAARRRGRGLLAWALEGNPAGRALVLRAARKRVLSRTGGHYPAPLKALESTGNALRMRRAAGLAEEARLVGELVPTPVSKNLIWLFLASQAVKKGTGVDGDVPERKVRRAGLLGAGTMGGAIAWLLADHGIPIRMKDIRRDALLGGLKAAAAIFGKALRRKRLDRRQVEARMNRISTTLDYRGFRTLDLVVEAVVENLEVKWKVLDQVDAAVSSECIVASNTSSLPISQIASRSARPDRVVGMHFFNPVDRMPLVEVIRGEKTSDEAVATVYVLARSLGKTPVVVRDRPGFLVNRILAPYLDEAVQLVADGASVEAVDRSLVRFGMPMGPLTLYDQVGIDIASHVAAILTDAFGERLGDASLLTPLVEAGRLGKKAGVGFYRHEGGKPQPDPGAESLVRAGRPTARRAPGPDEIVERCILRMIDEGARCLEEDVVRDAEDLDLAMVFGTGFPPFRGGLMRHADTLGPAHVVERLESRASTHGIRFQPSERLRQGARDGTSFRKPIIG